MSTDQILISIGTKASSIYEITGHPVPQTTKTTNQTVGAVSNISLPEQHDLTSDVSRADTVTEIFSPAPNASPAAPERVHQELNNIRPLSSNGLFTSSTFQSSVCVISPPSVTLFEQAVDDCVDDIHIHPDHPLGLMEITDEYIHAVYIIPHIKINDDIQFRALKLDSSFPNKTEDHLPIAHVQHSGHLHILPASV